MGLRFPVVLDWGWIPFVKEVSFTAAATTKEQAARRAQRRPSSIEGGPLAGVVDRQLPSRAKSSSDGLAGKGGDGGAADSAKWLKRQATRQDEIMTLAIWLAQWLALA